MEAQAVVTQGMSLTASVEDEYVVVLINASDNRADVAVEIRLALPAILW
jgi:hypothetical protein